jgi:serine/threonine-protein kinase
MAPSGVIACSTFARLALRRVRCRLVVPVFPSSTQICPKCGATYGADAAFCPLDGTPLAPRPKPGDPYLGTVIGKDIELREIAGSGAMGKVYRGHQRGTERDVAVKILHTELSDKSQLVQRFYREAKIAGKLRHPHVVEVYFTGDLPDGASYIVMEYLDGPALSAVLERSGGSLPIERALAITLQVCDAVGEAHAQGIVHRDLKPENVMLVTRGNTRDWVKVLDFGIARAALPDESMQTAAGAVFGTAKYISPEGAQGLTVEPPSDVYSIAVMLYQMLAGHPPFDAELALGLLIKHVHDAPPPLRSWPLAASVPVEIERVVMENLSKRAEERAQDGKALAAAIVRAAKASGVSLGGVDRYSLTDAEGSAPRVSSFVAPTLDDAQVPPVPPVQALAEPQKSSERPPAPKSNWARVVVAVIAFTLGVGLTVAFMLTRPPAATAKPDAERLAFIDKTRGVLADGHYVAPPGQNVRELVAEGLKRWPEDGELKQLRSEAEHEMITMAMAARSSGDLVGARNLARDAYTLDSTDNSARFLRAQLEDELKGISTGATISSGAPRLVFESPPVAKPGEKVEMTCRIVTGAQGPKAKVTGVRVSLFPNGQTTNGTPVSLTLVDPLNAKASLVAPTPGSYDLSFEATVDGTVVRAMRDLDVSP